MLHPFAQLIQHCWGHARALQYDLHGNARVYKVLSVVSFHYTLHVFKLLQVVASVWTPLPTTSNICQTDNCQQCWELLHLFARSFSCSKTITARVISAWNTSHMIKFGDNKNANEAVTMSQPLITWLTPNSSWIKLANPSFNHRSFHHRMVTRFPNHWKINNNTIIISFIKLMESRIINTGLKNSYALRCNRRLVYSQAGQSVSRTQKWVYQLSCYGKLAIIKPKHQLWNFVTVVTLPYQLIW